MAKKSTTNQKQNENGNASALLFREEEISRRMADLRRKVLEAPVSSDDERLSRDVANERNMVEDDKRLYALLEEAQSAIRDFEELMKQRLITDKENLREFEELKKLVTDLERQRDMLATQNELLQKKHEEEIRSLTAAQQKQLEELGDRVEKTLGMTLEKFLKELEELEIKRAYLFEQQQKAGAELVDMTSKLEIIIKQGQSKLKPTQGATHEALLGLGASRGFSEYIENLSKYRKELGWTRFTEKNAIDFVLHRKKEFMAAEEKSKSIDKNREDMRLLDEEIKKRVDQYRNLIMEAEQGNN